MFNIPFMYCFYQKNWSLAKSRSQFINQITEHLTMHKAPGDETRNLSKQFPNSRSFILDFQKYSATLISRKGIYTGVQGSENRPAKQVSEAGKKGERKQSWGCGQLTPATVPPAAQQPATWLQPSTQLCHLDPDAAVTSHATGNLKMCSCQTQAPSAKF